MTQNQKDVEDQVLQYVNSLKEKRNEIKNIKGKNSSFSAIQQSLLATIDQCITEAEKRVVDVNNGAIWDNLVIAFFGETNAGKSTIIETFRILFGEHERSQKIRSEGDCVDGLIVGDGHSDFTKVYKEYNLTIAGKPFTLIDVPGIEGNESDYENEIKTALNRAHYVFYVQGQNKKPDSGTAIKIKKYLREWVKVYSIYNVRGVAANYDEEEERVALLSEGQRHIEQQIQDTFKELLGSTYMGNITLQAYLAMCSNAKFASSRADLQRAQSKLLSYFGSSKSLLEFSQFSSLTNVIKTKTKNFTNEIVEANKEKNKALLHRMFQTMTSEYNGQNASINKLFSDIKKFEEDVKKDFSFTKNNIKAYSNEIYDEIFDKVYSEVAWGIDLGLDDIEGFSKNITKEIVNSKIKELETYTRENVKALNDTIHKRKTSLDQKISLVFVYGGVDADFNISFGDALDKLDISTGDVLKTIFEVGGAIPLFFLGPLGWGTAVVSLFLAWLIGGRDKKAEAKLELKKSVEKARSENRSNYNSAVSLIGNDLQSKCNDLCLLVEEDVKNLHNIQRSISLVQNLFKREYSKLNISEYGKL